MSKDITKPVGKNRESRGYGTVPISADTVYIFSESGMSNKH